MHCSARREEAPHAPHRFPLAIIMDKSGQVCQNDPSLPDVQAHESITGCKRPDKLCDAEGRNIATTLPCAVQSNAQLVPSSGLQIVFFPLSVKLAKQAVSGSSGINPAYKTLMFPQIRHRLSVFCTTFLGMSALVSTVHAIAPDAPVILGKSISKVSAPVAVGPPDIRVPHIVRSTLKATESGADMDFELSLKMRDFAGLQARLARGERIPREEMVAKYFPLDADYKSVITWAQGQGFQITRGSSNNLAVFVRAKVSRIQQALKADFARVDFEGKEFTSAVSPPLVPASVSSVLVGINGLQPHLRARKHLVHPHAQPNSLTGTNPPFTPAQVLKAYKADALAVSGSGQAIAIVIDRPPLLSDLQQFWSTYTNYNVAQMTANYVPIDVLQTGTFPAPEGEESLDTEWSSSIAPGARIRVYAASDLSFTNLDLAYQQVYDEATAHPEYGIHQMSMSYGIGELDTTGSQVSTDSQYFASLTSAGVTVFASSGDGASTPGNSGTNPDTSGPLQVESPASDMCVTGVGGTSLVVDSGTNVTSEKAWVDSGGGVSIYFVRPTWQTGTGVPAGSTRLVPDVSAIADPNTGVYIVVNGAVQQVGGTSLSSPVWAAFCALINQARANVNLAPVGLLGPKLYPLTVSSNFRDITSGSNSIGAASNGNYVTGAGYDMVTGIGVPVMQTLIPSLVGLQTTPLARTIPPGSNVTFTVAASGTAANYQWQRMPIGSSVWSNVSNSGTYSGATSASLTINATVSAMSGDRFQCILTTGTAATTTAPPSTLVVDTPLAVTTLAGQLAITGTQDGTGSAAQFSYPSGVAMDSSGNMYIADFLNNTIRKVTPAGVVTTPYGQPGVSGTKNGTGNNALFNTPNSVAADSADNLYVADSGNNTIRKITPAGVVSTLAGKAPFTGTANGTGASARFNAPQGVTVDSSGNVYVADTNNQTIRKITSSGTVTTLAGTPRINGYINATGTAAQFNSPLSVAVDSSGNVYVADLYNYVVRKVTPAGVVTTPYGQPGVPGRADGVGNDAMFFAPIGLAIDSSNNLYIADSHFTAPTSGNNLLRKATPAGVVSSLAGAAGVTGSADGTGSAAQFFSLQAIAVNNTTHVVSLADTFNQTIRLAGIAPVVLVSPGNQTVVEGTSATFSVTASGIPAPAYQWQRLASGSSTWTSLGDVAGTYAGTATATLTVSNSTLAMSGDQFQCVLSNGFPPSATSSTGLLTVQTGYTHWASSFFTTQQLSNPAISGLSATPQNDGVMNALKYLCDINPSVPMAVADRAALPVVGAQTISGTQYLTLTYRQNQTLSGVTVTVQTSLDLQSWQTVTPDSNQTIATDPATGDPIIQIKVNTNSNPRLFMRLQISVQ